MSQPPVLLYSAVQKWQDIDVDRPTGESNMQTCKSFQLWLPDTDKFAVSITVADIPGCTDEGFGPRSTESKALKLLTAPSRVQFHH